MCVSVCLCVQICVACLCNRVLTRTYMFVSVQVLTHVCFVCLCIAGAGGVKFHDPEDDEEMSERDSNFDSHEQGLGGNESQHQDSRSRFMSWVSVTPLSCVSDFAPQCLCVCS